MSRKNTVLVSVAGGEVSPEIYGRIDLPSYQRGYQRVQNYEVLPQGGARYRNGFEQVSNSRGLGKGRIISFSFSEQDTYEIEITNQKMRFKRDFASIMNPASITITAASKANPCVITAVAHGLSNGQEIFISGILGMVELNNQFFIVAGATTDTFQLQTIFGQNINSTAFLTYVSGGTIQTPYEITVPYVTADLNQLHYHQSADTIYITSQKYAPYKLTRAGNTNWAINYFTRTQDPFNQVNISSATNANPGVFTTSANHKMVVGDTVYIDGLVGGTWPSLNTNRYTVNTVPGPTTFTISNNGVPVNTTAFGTLTNTTGISIDTANCPATLAFLGSARLTYANWQNNPPGIVGSREPDPTTGVTRFDDFTTGANDDDSFAFTLAPVFDEQDAIQWITSNNNVVVLGCASSIRIMTGSGGSPNPITPSSIDVNPINNTGAAPIQPYSNGLTVYYVDQTGRRIQSFVFSIAVDNYVTVNQNLVASQISDSPFIAIAQQRREANLLWVLREDGVLAGLTFDEIESVYGWHRHYIGGKSNINGVNFSRANVLSISVEPRLNDDAVLWMLVERQQANGNTYRSVEYWNPFIRFYDPFDYYSGNGYVAQAADQRSYNNATYEQIKDSIHVDCDTTYDGSLQSTVTMTPSAISGTITLTASGNFFNSSMVGQEIWKAYDQNGNGGGRAKITSIVSATVANATVGVPFDNTTTIAASLWYLTTSTVFGLLNFVGENLAVQTDGAPAGNITVASDGSLMLKSQSSVVHAGYGYLGLLATMNIDNGGDRGSAQAKKRKLLQAIPRFLNTVGARIGTNLWNTLALIFKPQTQVTDRPTDLYNDVMEWTLDDSWARTTKQIILMQDIPSPQTVLSLDIMVETADD